MEPTKPFWLNDAPYQEFRSSAELPATTDVVVISFINRDCNRRGRVGTGSLSVVRLRLTLACKQHTLVAAREERET